MARHREWERLFRLWFRRLIPDPGWTLVFDANDELKNDAELTMQPRYREATFHYRPSAEPRSRSLTACHEVCHLVIARIYCLGSDMFKHLDSSGVTMKAFDAAVEEAVEDLARAFLRAYGESDG